MKLINVKVDESIVDDWPHVVQEEVLVYTHFIIETREQRSLRNRRPIHYFESVRVKSSTTKKAIFLAVAAVAKSIAQGSQKATRLLQ